MSEEPKPMHVAVVGVGRMGRHHARTYASMPDAKLMAVVDRDVERAETIAEDFGGRAFESVEALLASDLSVDAVSVAVPTAHHMTAARPLLEKQIACLIEKPLAGTVAEAKQIADLAASCGAVLQVGHTERFNPAVRAVAAMNITPRFLEINRISPMTFRSLDVGVVMDMMIHDLDIVLMLVGSPIKKVDAAGVAVFGQTEDIANARIVFESGTVANITASRLALKTERKMRFFSERAYVSLDYQRRNGLVIRPSGENMQALAEVRTQIESGTDLSDLDYSSIVQVDELTMDLPPGEDDPLTAELRSFLNAARSGETPAVTAQAGYAAVDAAERVVEAVRAHQWSGVDGLQINFR